MAYLNINRKLNYSDIGWIPVNKIKPHNNHQIVLLIQEEKEEELIARIGYYENEKFEIDDRYIYDKYVVHYWFPIPSIY